MATRGRPRKTTLTLEENETMETPGIHVIVRYLSRLNRSNPSTGEISGTDFDDLLDAWYKDGYRVAGSHYIGDNTEGHGVMVILQKE